MTAHPPIDVPAATPVTNAATDDAPPATLSAKHSLLAMAGAIVILHVLGWGILLIMVAGHHLNGPAGTVLGLGLGATVYALGLRHALDADHIAAIDNTTRKLIQDGQRPLSVGFWFSLGHSTVVFVVCLLLSFGVRALAGELNSDGSTLRTAFGTIGTIVSATFLIVLAVFNMASFANTVALTRKMRRGETISDDQLGPKGIITRLVGGRLRAITKPWHIYPVGVLFGLGFDTATEVGLLALTGGAAALLLPWYAILALPLIFAAGMSLLDTIDGTFMNYVYRWAFDQPLRKLYYNLIVTGISIVFALGIGIVEISALLSDTLHITSGPLAKLGALDMGWVGIGLAAGFAVIAVVVFWRAKHRRRPDVSGG